MVPAPSRWAPLRIETASKPSESAISSAARAMSARVWAGRREAGSWRNQISGSGSSTSAPRSAVAYSPARSACSIARATFSPARSSASATRSSARAMWSCACSECSRTFASARSTFSRARAARSSARSRSRSSRCLSESLDISYIVPLACSYAVPRPRTRYEMNQDLNTSHAVVAEGRGKRYGEQWPLREFDLAVPTGSVLGLLGHNGAGKTTAIRILTTLAAPTEGSATVAGHDVVSRPNGVRAQIGLPSQAATVDGLMSGFANLEMIGRLYHLPRKVARARAGELLAELQLEDAGDPLVKEYSGGMRRRLDLAASLVASPPVLFLDEPTTGLDPESRNELWDMLRQLVGGGTTVILTTQYLEEADQLADDVVLLDHGKIVATGSPVNLKERHGGERVRVTG